MRPARAGRTATWLAAGLLAAAALIPAAALAQGPFAGTWAFTSATPAPWLAPDQLSRAHNNPTVRQARITFTQAALQAPTWMACRPPGYALMQVPPDGLFEGGLLDPARGLTDAAGLATRLGFPPGDVPTIETRCHGLRFHLAGPDRMLFALDNVIYTFTRAPAR